MSELGPTIKRLRTERGMSLQKLGDAAGLSKAHVWDLERSASDNPSVEALAGLAGALGVPAVDLFRAALRSTPA